MRPDSGRSRAVLILLVLASVTIITLDARHDTSGSPVDPLRSAVGSVLGPVEDGASTALHPLTSIPDHFGNVDALRHDNAALQTRIDTLTTRLRAEQANNQRNVELNRIGQFAAVQDYDVVPAQVIAMGPAQSFSRTVTIDAGRQQGVVPDLTVINGEGLVGRVIAANATTATVLLIVDRDSTVGGRLSRSMELGFLTGDGSLSGTGALELSLVDHSVSPHVGDEVVSWGSHNHAPYLPGIPIGKVVSVHSSPADLTQTAQIRPYVDFSSLDVVGVVVRAGQAAATNLAGGVSR